MRMEELLKAIKKLYDESSDPIEHYEMYNKIANFVQENMLKSPAPVSCIQRIPLELVQANDYNPNAVAHKELKLLYTSIKEDGYTQPIVTIYDEEIKKYVIIDGFHRYFTIKTNKDIYELYNGHVPCVVLKKDINDRMASTVRHNRARGHHSVNGMGSLVFSMLANGWSDDVICNNLGLESDELLRLKHITGFSKLFKDVEYGKMRETDKQVEFKKQHFNGLKEQENE